MIFNKLLKIFAFAFITSFSTEAINMHHARAGAKVEPISFKGGRKFCLNIDTSDRKGMRDGLPVIAYKCEKENGSEYFEFLDNGLIRATNLLKSRSLPICIGILPIEGRGSENGSPLVSFYCFDERGMVYDNQFFKLHQDGTIRAPKWGGLCLGISNSQSEKLRNGIPILAVKCNGAQTQKFRFGSLDGPE